MTYLIIGVIGILVIFFAMVMIIDSNRFVIREYTITNGKIEKDYNFVLLSDLHNKQYGKDNIKLLNAIDRLKPDSIMIAGDMITAKPNKKYDIPIHLIKNLTKKYAVYYGIGNHEYRLKIYQDVYGNDYEDYIGHLRDCGVYMLENDSVCIVDTNFAIQGIMIDRKYYKRFHKTKMNYEYLKTLMGTVKHDKMQIFLAHNPEYFEEYVNAGADLVLSGHIHGGVMPLPILGGVISPKCTLFPKYDGGKFTYRNGTMILSRGLGMHTLPIRIFNPGELIVVHLKTCK